MVNNLNKKEQDVLKIMKDPVLWVTEHIGEPRWYQQLVLRHPHHRILLRMGRRLGKCIAYSQRIMDPETGKYTRIQDLYEQGVDKANIYTLDGQTMKASHSFHIEDNGKKEVFAVKTTDGSEVHLTENHPVLTPEGWKDVGDLQFDDTIAVPTSLPYKGTIKKTEEELNELLGDSKQLLEELPKDIYEWEFKVLERFLLTLLSKHRDKKTSKTNPSVLLTNIEVAKKLKHLCLRIGVVSTLRKEGSSYRLTLLGEHNVDYVFSSLSSVRSIGEQQTYDVHVPETHNLVVEDIFVHNTWTMSSHMLWVAMTSWGGRLAKKGKRGVDILVATPYDVQAKEIYDTLLETIQNNEALSSSIEYNKQGPPREIKFKNGSVIKLFTAGTSSSSDAASIRGQRADQIGNTVTPTF